MMHNAVYSSTLHAHRRKRLISQRKSNAKIKEDTRIMMHHNTNEPKELDPIEVLKQEFTALQQEVTAQRLLFPQLQSLVQELQKKLQEETKNRLDQEAKHHAEIIALKKQRPSPEEHLFNAAQKGFADELDVALKLHANVFAKNDDGQTALHLAIINNQLEIAETLLTHEPALLIEENGHGQIAIQNMTYLDDTKKIEWIEALFRTIRVYHDKPDTFEKICVALPNLGKQLANKLLISSAKTGDIEWVKLALKHHADINVKIIQYDHDTALHKAICFGHVDIVRLLIAEGADPSITDYHHSTALYHAIQAQKRLPYMPVAEIATSLLIFSASYGSCAGITDALAAGADLLGVDASGETALHKAVRGGNPCKEALKVLLKKYAEMHHEISIIKNSTVDKSNVSSALDLAKQLNGTIATKKQVLKPTPDWMLATFGKRKAEVKMAEKEAKATATKTLLQPALEKEKKALTNSSTDEWKTVITMKNQ